MLKIRNILSSFCVFIFIISFGASDITDYVFRIPSDPIFDRVVHFCGKNLSSIVPLWGVLVSFGGGLQKDIVTANRTKPSPLPVHLKTSVFYATKKMNDYPKIIRDLSYFLPIYWKPEYFNKNKYFAADNSVNFVIRDTEKIKEPAQKCWCENNRFKTFTTTRSGLTITAKINENLIGESVQICERAAGLKNSSKRIFCINMRDRNISEFELGTPVFCDNNLPVACISETTTFEGINFLYLSSFFYNDRGRYLDGSGTCKNLTPKDLYKAINCTRAPEIESQQTFSGWLIGGLVALIVILILCIAIAQFWGSGNGEGFPVQQNERRVW